MRIVSYRMCTVHVYICISVFFFFYFFCFCITMHPEQNEKNFAVVIIPKNALRCVILSTFHAPVICIRVKTSTSTLHCRQAATSREKLSLRNTYWPLLNSPPSLPPLLLAPPRPHAARRRRPRFLTATRTMYSICTRYPFSPPLPFQSLYEPLTVEFATTARHTPHQPLHVPFLHRDRTSCSPTRANFTSPHTHFQQCVCEENVVF